MSLLLLNAGPASPSSVINPASFGSYKLGINAHQPKYTDQAGTTPATSAGDAIRNVPDQSGSGNTLTRADGSAGLVLRTEGGHSVFSIESAGYVFKNVSSGSLSNFTLHALVKLPNPSVNAVLMTFGNNSTQPVLAPQWTSGKSILYPVSNEGSGEVSPLYHSDGNWRVMSWSYNGTGIRTFLDGAEIGPSSGRTDPTTGQGIVQPEPDVVASFTRACYGVGRETSFPASGDYRLAELNYYEATQDLSITHAQFRAYYQYNWRTLFSLSPTVVFIFNSLGQNYVVTPSQTIPYYTNTGSSKTWQFVNASRPSITTPQMITRRTLDYTPFFTGTPTPRIAVVLEGYNDAGTAAQRFARLTTLYQALRADGATYVIGCTLPVRTGEDAGLIATLNGLILASADLDDVADFGNTVGLTTADADGVHYTAAQNQTAANILVSLIDGVLP